MPSITVTINTISSGPFELSQIFAGNNYSGALTIKPSTPPTPPSKPNYLSVQSDGSNAATNILVGDANLQPTVSGCIGKKLSAGMTDVMQGPSTVPLVGRYINADVNGGIANIEVYGGFQ